jgi:flagellar biosynthesis/type III secretory pathway chaperone
MPPHVASVVEVATSAAEAARLRAHLEEELTLQREALVLLERKKALLVKQDAAGLAVLLAESDPLWARLEDLTKRRERLVATFARRLKLAAADVTVARLAALAPPEERGALQRVARELATVLSSVASLNRRNNALARQALELNRALLHILLGSAPPVATYGRNGVKTDAPAVHTRVAREI